MGAANPFEIKGAPLPRHPTKHAYTQMLKYNKEMCKAKKATGRSGTIVFFPRIFRPLPLQHLAAIGRSENWSANRRDCTVALH